MEDEDKKAAANRDQVLEAVAAAYDDEAVAAGPENARLTVLHTVDGMDQDWTIYALQEEPHMCWLTIVEKPDGKPPKKIGLGGRKLLLGVREAIDRVLAGYVPIPDVPPDAPRAGDS